MLSPVSLPQVLASREARVLRQRRLLGEHGVPVVSVTLVSPGPFKDTPALRSLRDAGLEAVRRVCAELSWPVRGLEQVDAVTGPEAVVAVDALAVQLKEAMVSIEDGAEWARLLDLDVIDVPGSVEGPLEPISRSASGLAPRRCLVCERPAKECARAQTHPLPDLLAAATALTTPLARDASRTVSPGPCSRDGLPDALPVWAEQLGDLAHRALLTEVRHTPKPGLVDRANNGAHDDMDLALFETSAEAIRPFLPRFVAAGARKAHLDERAFLDALRPLGMNCETAMFAATGGINTHKGAVFALGLLLASAGRLLGRGVLPDPERTCQEAARIGRGTLTELGDVETMLATGSTAGQRLFASAGLSGARGEAASGYASVRSRALPAFHQVYDATGDEEAALGQALLELMVTVEDTNLAKDGGVDALRAVRDGAQALLDAGGALAPGFTQAMTALDATLIAADLSPGGCADLLALTWFLARWPAAELLGA